MINLSMFVLMHSDNNFFVTNKVPLEKYVDKQILRFMKQRKWV